MLRNGPPVYTPSQSSGRSAAPDASRTRLALSAALEEWWQRGRLPSTDLLRDGLFVLQAGHTLDDAELSLLLRAALANHKGMVTALRHQVDPERTAVIVADALLAPPPDTLTLPELQRLRSEDETSAEWMAALPAALHEETSSADAGRRRRALSLIEALGASLPLPGGAAPALEWPFVAPSDDYELVEESWASAAVDQESGRGLRWLKAALLLVLLAGLVLGGLWLMQRAQTEGMVTIPAGSYRVPAAAGGDPVEVTAFAIDRYEVTNGDYRRCLNRGRCPQPTTPAGETRPNYLLDPAFERFPVVNVDWEAANAFCAFAGKRLPTAAEWEVAASQAPGMDSLPVYPWGEQFQIQRANSARTGLGDTQEVGSYRPSGDSPLGVSDMAGNVAEWTATNVGRAEGGEEDRFLVKGGSYVDPPAHLAVAFSTPLEASFSAPWLGFRCAMELGE